jgi:hypothetical protein
LRRRSWSDRCCRFRCWKNFLIGHTRCSFPICGPFSGPDDLCATDRGQACSTKKLDSALTRNPEKISKPRVYQFSLIAN